MAISLIYFFPDQTSATLAEVGGKGLSLMQGSLSRLPVPKGFILSTRFFEPWLQTLTKTQAWDEFQQPDKYDLKRSCDSLKQHAAKLFFTSQQEQELLAALQKFSPDTLFAVRSSSPEEDLEGSSFAGGYETVLGVSAKNIQAAVKTAFASCLDFRVAVYKSVNGFDTTSPKLAVIVQEQIPSEIAGVGFSLNPVTNNFDEAVLTANWGLGETVVEGIATPDTYIVDKALMRVTNKKLGTKETSIWLLPNGGTKHTANHRQNEFTLSETQILELTKLIKHVEALYQKPIDIEWAFAKDKLYLLQARPITGYVPLSPEMLTNPGERKQLFLDMTISVQGITHPVSVMATSFFKALLKSVGHQFFNRDLSQNIKTAPAVITDGRMYLNLSVLMLLLGHKRLRSFMHQFDPLAEKALSEIDMGKYTATARKITLLPWKLSLKLPVIATHILSGRRNPLKMHEQTQKKLRQFVLEAKALADQNLPIPMLADQLTAKLINQVFLRTVPLFITATAARAKIKKILNSKDTRLLDQLDKALPNNLTTQMGLALFQVSQVMPPDLSLEKLTKGLQENSLPEPFLNLWQNFLSSYGFRGPEEIDLVASRYHENSNLLLDILVTLKASGKNTQAQFDNNQQMRQHSYEMLYQQLVSQNSSQARHFAKLYKFYETFAGYRETHKYYAALVVDLLRQRILQVGQKLFEAKRLDSIDQVFDLTLKQLDQASKDRSLDLQKLAKENRQFSDKLAKISRLPTLIDSRGLIIKASAQIIKQGEVIGMPVSAGVVQGKVKVLHSPTEKPFLKGEILVARVTDPGWTPLFVNAAAIILEVGGMLQHGALVAREYGLPCVTGVENATSLWPDGTEVEVDGSAGIVRVIEK